MDPEYDAVVVGAGPAGSTAAYHIAAAGYRTLLLEEHSAVGEPLHCAGLVSPRTLELAGIGDEFVVNRFRGGFVNSPSGQRLNLGGGQVYATAIDRVRLDQELARRAEAAGATLRTRTKLTEISRQNGTLRLVVSCAGRREQLHTRLLIGADGAQSFVARWLNDDTGGRPERLVAISAEARLRTERRDFVELIVGHRVAPGFFAWIIPIGDDTVRIGLATNNGQRPIHYLRTLAEAYPQVFEGAEILRLRGGVIPLRQRRRIYGDNVMLVGDAAGHVKPTSGGGIYLSLLGGRLSAQTAAKALGADDVSAGRLHEYGKSWSKRVGGELRRGRDLRRVFLSLSDDDLDRLIRMLQSGRLQRIIARHGDIDFPSALFARLALCTPAMGRFIRVPLALRHWMRSLGRPPR